MSRRFDDLGVGNWQEEDGPAKGITALDSVREVPDGKKTDSGGQSDDQKKGDSPGQERFRVS